MPFFFVTSAIDLQNAYSYDKHMLRILPTAFAGILLIGILLVGYEALALGLGFPTLGALLRGYWPGLGPVTFRALTGNEVLAVICGAILVGALLISRMPGLGKY